MKITDIKTLIVGNPWKNWVFVQVLTDEGITGLGEGSLGLNTLPVEAAVREIRHLCIGKDPRDVQAIWTHLYKSLYLVEGQVQHAAIAAIEIACWDILGKSLGVPLYRLFGGPQRDGIRAYANGWYKGPRDPAYFAKAATEVVAMGYTALKFDPFGPGFRLLSREEEELSLAIVAAVREAVGPAVDVIIEAHDRFLVTTAIRIGQRLEEFNVLWYEAPTISSDIEDVVQVARAVRVPLGIGERFTTPREFSRLLQHEIVDYLLPETLDLGGAIPTRSVIGMADAHNAVVAIHNARGPVVSALNCHLDKAMSNFLIQETFHDFNEPWTHEVVRGHPEIRDGQLWVSDRPGLGLELDEEIAQAHPYSPTNFMRFFQSGWERRFGERTD